MPSACHCYLVLSLVQVPKACLIMYGVSVCCVSHAQEEAHDVLCSVVLQNVPTVQFNLRPKALYVAQMARRVILAHLGLEKLDDKVGWVLWVSVSVIVRLCV